MANSDLTEAENVRALENWQKMPDDMREFVAACVELGMIDGRHGLAACRVAVLPDRFPPSNGVIPCIDTQAEREAIAAIRNRGQRK